MNRNEWNEQIRCGLSNNKYGGYRHMNQTIATKANNKPLKGDGIFTPSKGSFSAFKKRRNNNDYMKNLWEASGEYTWPQKGKGWKDTLKEVGKYALPAATIGTLALGTLTQQDRIADYLGAYDYLADVNYEDFPMHGYRDGGNQESWFNFNQRWGENVIDPFLSI